MLQLRILMLSTFAFVWGYNSLSSFSKSSSISYSNILIGKLYVTITHNDAVSNDEIRHRVPVVSVESFHVGAPACEIYFETVSIRFYSRIDLY
jgi:hypothetical protein